MVLKMPEVKEEWNIGHADLYVGKQYSYPYFFENATELMMKNMGKDTIDFKTWKGEFFQFRLETVSGHDCLVLTSTLRDCAFFPAKSLSLEKAKATAQCRSEKKTMITGSFSGYSTTGKKKLRQYATLETHLAEQGLELSEEVLTKIFKELKRRAKDE